jgi:hypothetical protein
MKDPSCLANETNAVAWMFLATMRHEHIPISTAGFDWKAAGYLVSILSVFFLGAVAASKQDAPWWYFPALVAGMATSILGMGFRYKAHLHQKREIKRAQAEAEASKRST